MNSSGNVLAWSLMFENDDSVIQFLDHALKRFEESPTAASSPVAERFQRFPNHKLPGLAASQSLAERTQLDHGEHSCVGGFQSEKGALVAQIVGRALAPDGAPLRTGVRSQESYAEDRLEISENARNSLVRAANSQGAQKVFPIPADFSRELVASAYLGMLDVGPLGGRQIGGEVLEENIQLWGRSLEPAGEGLQIEIWGSSLCEGKSGQVGRNTDGRDWRNRVELNWTGRVVLKNKDITSLAALGEGSQDLHWKHGVASSPANGEAPRTDVAHLPSGRPIQFSGPVRFGITLSQQ